jgi:hypothetical protein
VSRPRRLTTFGSLASAIAALLLPAGAVAQERTVETAASGAVIAELSYIKRSRGRGEFRFHEFRDFRVRILRGGVVLYDKAVGKPCEEFCTPAESALTGKHVGLRDLNGDGEPEAIVDLFTGGTSAACWSSLTGTTRPRTCTAARGSTRAAASWRATTAATA